MILRFCLALVLLIPLARPQISPPKQNAGQLSDAEQKSLRSALERAGGSPIELIHALEQHLAQYPASPRRPELERILVKAAIEANDANRTILYGERVLAREPENVQVLERVATALLEKPDHDRATRALDYAQRIDKALGTLVNTAHASGAEQARFIDQVDRAAARGLLLQAKATDFLGDSGKATQLVVASYERYPSAEAAHEAANLFEKAGKTDEAIRYLTEAFTIADPHSTSADRARERAHMGELYRKTHGGSETGLGDLVLQAYDRTTAMSQERRVKLRQYDPNADTKNPLDFTLSSVDGQKLSLAMVKGKVVVMDFWATWCGPCRVQHPLYEQLERKFHGRADVVFLSINTDEDRELVKPFLQDQKWEQNVYFDDGLSIALHVSSIPTTIVFGKTGELVSRLNGFDPGSFVSVITERIEEALKAPPAKAQEARGGI